MRAWSVEDTLIPKLNVDMIRYQSIFIASFVAYQLLKTIFKMFLRKNFSLDDDLRSKQLRTILKKLLTTNEYS